MAGGNRLVEAVQCWIVEGTGLLARVSMALALSTTHPRRQKQKSPSGGADGLAAINATDSSTTRRDDAVGVRPPTLEP
jgi:hypothetical protein